MQEPSNPVYALLITSEHSLLNVRYSLAHFGTLEACEYGCNYVTCHSERVKEFAPICQCLSLKIAECECLTLFYTLKLCPQ